MHIAYYLHMYALVYCTTGFCWSCPPSAALAVSRLREHGMAWNEFYVFVCKYMGGFQVHATTLPPPPSIASGECTIARHTLGYAHTTHTSNTGQRRAIRARWHFTYMYVYDICTVHVHTL